MSITIEAVISAWNRAEGARNAAEELSATWGTPSRIVGAALSYANALAAEHAELETAFRLQPKKFTGSRAIEVAAVTGRRLCKYADPIEDAREDVTVEEAREIAREDASLIWIDIA